jgi:hypothetical protein
MLCFSQFLNIHDIEIVIFHWNCVKYFNETLDWKHEHHHVADKTNEFDVGELLLGQGES